MDRNPENRKTFSRTIQSLSARRAWIEIYNYIIRLYWRIVALRKESVDRNFTSIVSSTGTMGRSPQGERG